MDTTPITKMGISRQLESVQPSLGPLGDVKPSPELPDHSGSFTTLLQQSLERMNGLQQGADAAVRAFALGQAPSVHDTMIAMEKADLSLRLTMKVRNKVVEAYQEIMRMQV
jgi:flagellar hook-basal body complex protein FliE